MKAHRFGSSQHRIGAVCALLLWAAVKAAAQHATLTVDADQPAHRIPATLWGIFFEDINCSADGGLYAELVRNRSFEDADKPEHWTLVTAGAGQGEIAVAPMQAASAELLSEHNRRTLRLRVATTQGGTVGVANDGFWGMALREGAPYVLSFYARCGDGFAGPLTASLETRDGKILASAKVNGLGPAWNRFQITLTARGASPNARLVLRAATPGTVWLDLVSLMPKQTWNTHGLRPDLARLLADLKPAFVRFPGGCWVEGDTMRLAYRWKQTIGPVAQRRTQYNIWQYHATHGLGYHEYLQMCEDLGAEPLFVINCGMSHRENVPMDQMGPFVQDALDALEYANGPVTSRWGAVRTQNGHPAPFHLKYLEIGNENGGPPYFERYALFHDAVKARYPDTHLIANVWGSVPGNRPLEILDEHYYSSPQFFYNHATHYDRYDRQGPKIYVGEYAVTAGCGQGNLAGALGEAAFMTGLERNSDVVVMASYAPLFANVNYKKWNPDLIYFDSARVCGTPSYYVQKLFGENRGDVVLPARLEFPPAAAPPPRPGGIGLGTWETRAEFKDLKVTKESQTLFEADFSGVTGWKPQGNGGEWAAADGVLRQNALGTDRRLVVGDTSWTDYTYSVKARKLSGAEGFLIMFQVRDAANWVWWNLGGWGNVRHALEHCDGGAKSIVGLEVPGKIETGRWYDIRVETKGNTARCYLDGQLLHEVTFAAPQPLYAAASRADQTGEIILKVVNAAPTAHDTEIRLRGVAKVQPKARAIVLTSASPADENSVAEPGKVVPKNVLLENAAPTFHHVLPPNSLSILRLRLAPGTPSGPKP